MNQCASIVDLGASSTENCRVALKDPDSGRRLQSLQRKRLQGTEGRVLIQSHPALDLQARPVQRLTGRVEALKQIYDRYKADLFKLAISLT